MFLVLQNYRRQNKLICKNKKWRHTIRYFSEFTMMPNVEIIDILKLSIFIVFNQILALNKKICICMCIKENVIVK